MRHDNHKVKILKNLKNEDYGLPNKRKYPIYDEKSLLLVIKYFNSVNKKEESELAKNILKKMAEFNIPTNVIEPDNKLNIYSEGKDALIGKEKYEFNQFYVSDKLVRCELSSNYWYKDIESAIKNYLKKHFNEIGGMNRTKLKVYTRNSKKNLFKTEFMGNIRVFVYNDFHTYDWDWSFRRDIHYNSDNDIEENQIEDSFNKLSNHIVEEKYKRKIISLGKENHLMLIPRLSFDKYNNSFMRFQEVDKVKNKIKLDEVISEDAYVISDIHFCKDNINEDKQKVNFINNTVRKNDILIILGDLGYMYNLDKKFLTDCVTKIKCKNKILILGNHDVFPLDYYYGIGIKSIYEHFYYKPKDWLFSHQPCNKGKNTINFHGHLHNSDKYYSNIKNIENKVNCYYKNFNKVMTIKELIKTE